MNEAFKKLDDLKTSTEIPKIKQALDKFKKASIENPTHESFFIDSILKSIFHTNTTTDFFDRIEDLFEFIRDPRNFIDELDRYTEKRALAVPTLMFINELRTRFDFEYEDFYLKIKNTVRKENCVSEGYLIFLIKTLKSNKIEEEDVKAILLMLSQVSIEVSSKSCVKVLYTIIIILRLHPGLFRIVKDMNQLYILLNSFESISKIVKRIFLEAENPESRPSMIFLENFVFPSFEEQQ